MNAQIAPKLPTECRMNEEFVSAFQIEEFNQIEGVVHDIVGTCYADQPGDMNIMRNWKEHFMGADTPFVETSKYSGNKKGPKRKIHTLWIEQIVAPTPHYGRDNA